MKNTILLLLAACASAFTATAQDVPGYRGKTMSIGYTPKFSIAVVDVNSGKKVNGLLSSIIGFGEADSVPTGILAPNTTHSFNFNYVHKRNASFMASVHFMKSGCWIGSFQDSYVNTATSYTTSYITPNYFAKISGFGLDVGYKWYKNHLAPLGRYSGYRLGINFYSGKAPVVESINMTYVNPWSGFNEGMAVLGDTKFKSTNIRLIYTWGKQTVIKDKLLLDTSVDWDMIGSTRGFFRVASDGGIEGDYDQYDMGDRYEKYAVRKMKGRTWCRDAVELRIGISYLL